MGNKGASSGKSGSAGGSSRGFSSEETKFKDAETRRELREATQELIDGLKPGEEITVAMARDSRDISGAGEVNKRSVKTYRVTNNKTLVDDSGNEYNTSDFANSVYRGTINFNAIEPGRIDAQEFSKRRYKNRGWVR